MSITPVYKFISGEDHHLQGLRKNTIWFASTKDLNDPYEGRINLVHSDVPLMDKKLALIHAFNEDNDNIKMSRKEVDAFIKKIGERAFHEHMKTNVEQHFNDMLCRYHEERYVLSLSKPHERLECNPFPQPLNLMIMWAHYANGFRGMCIEYDYHELTRSITELNGSPVSSRDIDYIEGCLPTIESKILLNDMVYKDNGTSNEIFRAFCSKHKSWEHENELRIVSTIHGENQHSAKSILRIFVSIKNPALIEDVEKILKAKNLKIELCIVSQHENMFGFSFKPVKY